MGGTDAEVPILWPSDAKRQLIGKDSDAWENWRRKEKGTAEYETVVPGECVISLILSRYSKNLKRQTDQCYSLVTAQFKLWTSITVHLQLSIICKQRKIHSRGVRAGWPKRHKEKRSPNPSRLPLSYICLPPSSLPYVNWANQEGCLFDLRSSLRSLDLPLFYFRGLFPSLSFSHHHFGLLFPILTTWHFQGASSF